MALNRFTTPATLPRQLTENLPQPQHRQVPTWQKLTMVGLIHTHSVTTFGQCTRKMAPATHLVRATVRRKMLVESTLFLLTNGCWKKSATPTTITFASLTLRMVLGRTP